jgi:NAD(P)-dependent dehydrogenase (short-subunit alcohol dehydrogenase family)
VPGCQAVGRGRCETMPGGDATLAAALHHGVDGDHRPLLQDADLNCGAVHLDRATPCGVRHAVEVAVDRDHAVLGDTALQAQHGLERSGRQRLQAGRSSAKCSRTTRCVVTCARALATRSSHWPNWALSDVRAIDIAVDDGARVEAAAGRVAQEDGKVDVLVANAGVPGGYASPTEQSIDDIRHVFEVNVFGAIRLIQAFTPLLKAAGSAAIVNVSSELGSLGSLSNPQGEFYGVNILGYNSSKTALNAVTVSFAKALAPFGIRVNSADPGYTATDFNGHTGYRTVEQAAEIIVQLATSDDTEQTGKFLNDQRALPGDIGLHLGSCTGRSTHANERT